MSPKRSQYIAEQWEQYTRTAIPLRATPGELREAHRAFYAGALGMLAIINCLTPDAPPTAADVQRIDAVYHELIAFQNQMKRGRV